MTTDKEHDAQVRGRVWDATRRRYPITPSAETMLADIVRLLNRLEAAEERIEKARAACAYLGPAAVGVLAALDGNQARTRIDETSLG